MEKRITRVIVITCFVFLIIPQAVFADSSWCWLTDTRPFDILPPVALATIVIEVLAIWLIPNTGKLMKTAVAVIAECRSKLYRRCGVCNTDTGP